jgi:hypothetical protein
MLLPNDVRRLAEAAGTRTPGALRDQALIGLLYWGALRLSEALALRPGDLSHDDALVSVKQSTGRPRLVGIERDGLELVSPWLSARLGLGLTDDKPLICTLRGGPLDPSYVRALLPRLARNAGLDARVSAMSLRRSRIAALTSSGTSAAALQARLGHTSPSTTTQLLRRISADVDGTAERGAAGLRVSAVIERLTGLARSGAAQWVVFPALARDAAQLIDADRGVVAIADRAAGLARAVGEWGGRSAHPAGVVPDATVPLDGGSLIAAAIRSESPSSANDLAAHEDLVSRSLAALGYRAAVAVPLRAGGRPWGAVMVSVMAPRALHRAASDSLALLAREADGLLGQIDQGLRKGGLWP